MSVYTIRYAMEKTAHPSPSGAVNLSVEQACGISGPSVWTHQDPVPRAPTRYVLEGTAFRQAAHTGRWSVVRSKVDPRRLIYRLDADGSTAFLSFARADEDILLFMDDDGNLLAGDSYFSYTLNRVTRLQRLPPL